MPITYPLTPPAIAGIGPQDITLSELNVVGEHESPFTLQRQTQMWPGQAWNLEANLPPMKYQQAEKWIAFLGALFGKAGFFQMGDPNRPTPQGPMTGSLTGGTFLSSGSGNVSGSQALLLKNCVPNIANWAIAGDYISPTPASLNLAITQVVISASHGLILARGTVYLPSVVGLSVGQAFTITGNSLANGSWTISSIDTVGNTVTFIVGISSGGTQTGGTFSVGNFMPARLHKVLTNASSDGSGNVTLDIFPSIRETIPDGTVMITKNCVGTFALNDNTTKWKIDRNGLYTISFKAKEYI